jgi:hypothetical protein
MKPTLALLGLLLLASVRLLAETMVIEGENPAEHNFDPGIRVFGNPPDPAATSGGKILMLWKQELEERKASYQFHVQEENDYYIWVASTNPKHPAVSPFLWSLDGEPPEEADAQKTTDDYGTENDKSFAWRLLHKGKLAAGDHTLQFVVTDYAKNNNAGRMVMYLDAIIITSDSTLKPSGAGVTEPLK